MIYGEDSGNVVFSDYFPLWIGSDRHLERIDIKEEDIYVFKCR